ncbi:MAG TPA: hypothetical protein VK934_11860 [Fimbriimonas sp.]|nr:hypothetical protein [Fimbriimonas sp.]
MTHRDRAWRRRRTRVLEHRVDEAHDWLGNEPAQGRKTHAEVRQHQPGKLTPVQSMKQDWQLRDDAVEGFSSDSVI